MSSTWGPESGYHDDGRTNAEYLAWVTEQIRERKRMLIDVLELQPGQHALDVGCGVGDDVIEMAQRVGPTGRAVGIDHADAMLDEARKQTDGLNLRVEFVKTDLYNLPFEDGVFDVVRSDRVFQHLTDPDAALAEIVRVTKPSGLVSLNDQDGDGGVLDYPDRDLFRRIRQAVSDNAIANAFAGRMLYGLLKRQNLEIVHIEPYFVAVTDLALADGFVSVSNWGDEAHEAGAVSQAEAAAWREQLETLDDASQFFGGGLMFHVMGRKPM